jgi:hypothetical protein
MSYFCVSTDLTEFSLGSPDNYGNGFSYEFGDTVGDGEGCGFENIENWEGGGKGYGDGGEFGNGDGYGYGYMYGDGFGDGFGDGYVCRDDLL